MLGIGKGVNGLDKEKEIKLAVRDLAVINLAEQKYKEQQKVGNTGYTPDDALVWSLEEYDYGYNLTEEEMINLKEEVYQVCNWPDVKTLNRKG